VSNNQSANAGNPSAPPLYWIQAVLTLWGKHRPGKKIPMNLVYETFSVLRQAYPEELGELSFEKWEGKYLSKDLETILFYLGSGGVLSVANPRWKYYSVEVGPESSLTRLQQAGGDTAVGKAQEMATRFEQYVEGKLPN